jgi:hypothetical protein
VLTNSAYTNQVTLTRALHAHLRWRNTHARHPDVLAAERRERARIRSERHHRWTSPSTEPPRDHTTAICPTRPRFVDGALAGS